MCIKHKLIYFSCVNFREIDDESSDEDETEMDVTSGMATVKGKHDLMMKSEVSDLKILNVFSSWCTDGVMVFNKWITVPSCFVVHCLEIRYCGLI